MEHQPYETWILEDASRTDEQERALQAHLQECAQCRRLLEGWKAVHSEIQVASTASPAPGFSRRFQASLAERRLMQQKLQVRRTLLGLGTGILVLFLALVVSLLLTSSPIDWMVKLMEFVLRAISDISTLQRFASSWLQAMPLSLSLAVWILFSTGFVLLVAGFGFTLWRVVTQGVHNHENHL